MEVNHLRECPCFEAPTEKALGEVCDAVSEAYAAWDDAVAADAMVA